jgi:thiosulfate dehydrogenase
MRRKSIIFFGIVVLAAFAFFLIIKMNVSNSSANNNISEKETRIWKAPDIKTLAGNSNATVILYGRSLVTNTAYYFGPDGIIANAGNGLNCENCHLKAGTKMFGNNFSKVAHGYPRFKERSGSMETIVKKVEDCFERSMNGNPIDSNGLEMKAIIAYLNWVGSNVSAKETPPGSGIEELSPMNRAASASKGKLIFIDKCQTCHGTNGEGKTNSNGIGYLYPPLWGAHSFNTGASIYRISKLAGFVKNNMPFGTTYRNPELTNEECWDVAAYVDSNYHPVKDTKGDWPDLTKKPFDDPDGPYADTIFSERDHKYGPYKPIIQYYQTLKKTRKQN